MVGRPGGSGFTFLPERMQRWEAGIKHIETTEKRKEKQVQQKKKSEKTSLNEGPIIAAVIKKASEAGMDVSIDKTGIVITVPEKKEKPDPKAALSIITPQEEKKIEQELKELLRPKGE